MTLEQSLFNLLLVEDEPADAHLAHMAFAEGRLPVKLHHVRDGVEALAFLQGETPYADVPHPDLILLDLDMPRMPGLQFLQRMKSIPGLRSIPVVVLTTSEAQSDILASYDLGASGFVVKPLDVDVFVEAVRKLCDYWIALVRHPARQG